MTIPEAKRTARIIEWRQLIHARQQSGQSVRAWCLRNGIRENSYYYWLRIIREEALCEAENKSGALVRVEPEKRNRSINLRPDNLNESCDTDP